MEKSIYNHTLAFILLFVSVTTFGQKKYSSLATSTDVSLEDKVLVGYKTSFDFTWSEMRKEWWKYAKEFGAPLNMKTYYKVTIPSETNDGNVNLEIFTQSTEKKSGSEFFLGLENERYKSQALNLLIDFKKGVYIADLLKQIDTQQKQSEDLSAAYASETSKKKKQAILNQITSIELIIEGLKEEIREIEKD